MFSDQDLVDDHGYWPAYLYFAGSVTTIPWEYDQCCNEVITLIIWSCSSGGLVDTMLALQGDESAMYVQTVPKLPQIFEDLFEHHSGCSPLFNQGLGCAELIFLDLLSKNTPKLLSSTILQWLKTLDLD